MITALTQETITPYASDAQTTQEPQGTDYTQGVRVGRTVPAKWWNWLFNAGTKRLAQSKNDAQDMLTEMQNVVTDAGITLNGSDSTQLTQAVVVKTEEQVNKYITQKRGFFTYWKEVPGIPTKPNAYSRDIGYIDGCYVISDRYGSGGYWTVHTSPDMVKWSTLDFSGYWSSCVDQNLTIVKYNGRYFMLRQLTHSASSQQYLQMWLYVSDDALNWTEVKAWSYSDAVGKSYFQACLFVTESRIGMLGLKGSGTTHDGAMSITTSSDGVNWSTDASLDVVTNSAGYNYSLTNGVYLAMQGYDFGTGIILGSGFINSSNVVTMLYQAYGEWTLNSWKPKAPVYKLSNGLFVFQDNVSNNGTLNWHTAPSTGNTPTVTARTYADSSASGYYYKLDGDVIIRKIANKVAEYSLDGINFTALSESIAKVGTNNYVDVLQSGDTYYCGKYKSTDMTNWQEISVPEGSVNFRVARVVPEANIVIGYSGTAITAFVSDSGNPWEQSSRVIAEQPTAPHTNKQLFRVDNVYFSGFNATSSGVNKRIGYTLYLR